jgi:hypothetical protein
MTFRLAIFGIVSALAVSCGGTTAPAPSPPAVPEPPPGAERLGGFTGAAPGRTALEVDLAGQNVVIHAICDGTGTLFVVPSLVEEERSPARPSGVAIFDCEIPPLDARVELIGLPIGKVAFTAYVVEGSGAPRPTVFSIAIEQGTD